MEWRELVGRRLAADVEADDPIERDALAEPA
jgi:hypothetical protein